MSTLFIYAKNTMSGWGNRPESEKNNRADASYQPLIANLLSYLTYRPHPDQISRNWDKLLDSSLGEEENVQSLTRSGNNFQSHRSAHRLRNANHWTKCLTLRYIHIELDFASIWDTEGDSPASRFTLHSSLIASLYLYCLVEITPAVHDGKPKSQYCVSSCTDFF